MYPSGVAALPWAAAPGPIESSYSTFAFLLHAKLLLASLARRGPWHSEGTFVFAPSLWRDAKQRRGSGGKDAGVRLKRRRGWLS